jgi:predicted deacetylase
MWGLEELTISELYHSYSYALTILAIIIFCLAIVIRLKIHTRVAKEIHVFFKKNPKTLFWVFVGIFIVVLLMIGLVQYKINELDKSTRIEIDEKIVIIEIDDYWNIDETSIYFDRFGYNMETFRSVSDVIDKHEFVATLGLTPYIFVEELVENYDLEDDEEMMTYLKELDLKGYELAMHGYNHCRNNQFCPKYEEVWYNIFNGKIDLENLFNGQTFFTYFPPGNTWTTEQYENIKKAGFFVIGNTHVNRAYWDEGVIITPRGYDPIYHYGWYQQDFRHTPVNEWIDEYEKTNLFILQLHCNTFDSQEKLDDLDTFLKHVKDDGAKVMTYKDFYYYIDGKRSERSSTLTGKIILDAQK